VVKQALPKYTDAGRAMLQKMDLTPVEKEGVALVSDLRPVLMSEMDRVWPELQEALIVEGNNGAKQLETNLQTVLDKRLNAIVQRHTQQVQTQTGLTQAQAAQVMTNITEAGKQAMLSMLDKRWGENEKKLEAISALVDQLPPLPPMTEAELLNHLRDTLIALVKYKLPDYDLEAAGWQNLAPVAAPSGNAAAPRPATPPKAAPAAVKAPPTASEIKQQEVKQLEEALKRPGLTADQRQKIQKALDEAKAGLNNG